MNHKDISWEQAKNRLASGFYQEVKYRNGAMASYTFEKGTFVTHYRLPTGPLRIPNSEPKNPQYRFRMTSM